MPEDQDSINSMLSALQPGDKILHYKIINGIGEGGMGEVYLARDLKLGRTVAIKVLPLTISRDEKARRRFLREAQSASRLNHPAIVTIHAIEETQGSSFIVMEYLEGKSLREILERGPLPLNQLLDFGVQLAEAIGAAHAAGLIHRDIKPANIMITGQNKLKILDFGLAKAISIPEISLDTGSLTQAGSVVGTVHYMSPEQARGEELDARTDIFSMGCVLYQAATGRMPFQGKSIVEIMHQIANTNPPFPSAIHTNLPYGFDSVIFRAMAKDKNQRFASAEEMAAALKNLKEFKPPVSTSVITTSAAPSKHSIAVLYFENLGGLTEQEYLRDGLTEDVITELSKVEKLHVFPRSAVAVFRDKEVTAPEIGRQLNASHVLAGSLRKAGNRVRVTAQLIRSDSGHSEWAERYDRELNDVFELQDEIARALASALSIRLTPAEEEAIRQKPAENPEAYDLYLQGRRLFRRGTKKDMLSAAELFQQAVSLDPKFALAYAGLGHVCGRIHRYYDQDPQWMDKGIQACERAMNIEPDLPESLSARAFLHYGHKEYDKAIRCAKLALERKQDCEGAYFALGLALNITDQLQEAASLADLAIEFNGDDYNAYVPYTTTFARLGDEAKGKRVREQMMRVLKMHLEWAPENARARILLAGKYAEDGMTEPALRELEKALAYSPNDASTLMNAACTYALLERKADALATLKKAVENGYRHADTLMRDPDLTCLRGEPEFEALVKSLS